MLLFGVKRSTLLARHSETVQDDGLRKLPLQILEQQKALPCSGDAPTSHERAPVSTFKDASKQQLENLIPEKTTYTKPNQPQFEQQDLLQARPQSSHFANQAGGFPTFASHSAPQFQRLLLLSLAHTSTRSQGTV